MMININIIEDKFYYNKNECTRDEIKELLKSTKNKIKINIISSNFFIKKYDFFIKNSYEKFIEEKINTDFHEKNNFLFHYENLKKENKIYLYAIRNDKFKFIYKNNKDVELIPIQFIIKKYLIKKYKKIKNITIIYSFNNRYDLLNIKNKKIEEFISFDNITNVNLYLKESKEDPFIIIDSNLENIKLEKFHNIFSLKEAIYEKIYKI